jgi:tripartite-type tricarboxylate transporter receptor subunit TctC
VLAAFALICALPIVVWGQAGDGGKSYPNRAVRLVVPYPPGGAPDQVARILGQRLAESLGQTFVIDNRPGASGIIGSEIVAKSTADGYTVLVTTNTTSAANASLFKKLPYDPQKDFAAVSRLCMLALLLVVKPEFSAQSLREFVRYAKSRQEPLSVGYWSAGSQVSAALLKSLGGINLLVVPYKGAAPALTDVIAGQISMTFADFAAGFAQVKAGKLRGLGVTSPGRSALAPELPALSEEMPGFDVTTWIGLAVPAATPRENIRRLSEAANREAAGADVKARFAAMGLDLALLPPDKFAEFIDSEIAKWARQVKAAGIEPE